MWVEHQDKAQLATWIVSLSMRRPSDEIGRTFNHVPDSLTLEVSNRAQALESGALSKRVSAMEDALRFS